VLWMACEPGLLFLQDAKLIEPSHPIFRVPGPGNSPVLDFRNFYYLYAHFQIVGGKAHEILYLSAAHCGAHDDLVPVLQNVLDRELEIRKCCGEMGKKRLCTFRTEELTRSWGYIDPVLS
jgi:hypothetical protein